jgi:hypothetical protein
MAVYELAAAVKERVLLNDARLAAPAAAAAATPGGVPEATTSQPASSQ